MASSFFSPFSLFLASGSQDFSHFRFPNKQPVSVPTSSYLATAMLIVEVTGHQPEFGNSGWEGFS